MADYTYTYFLNFSAQLFFMEAVLMNMFPRKKHFWGKLELFLTTYFLLGAGLIKIVQHIPERFYMSAVVYYLGIFLVSLVFAGGLFDMDKNQILFAGTAAYAIQHIGFSFQTLISTIITEVLRIGGISEPVREICFSLLPYILLGGIFHYLLIKKNLLKAEVKQADVRMLSITGVVLFTSIVLSTLARKMNSGSGGGIVMVCAVYAMVSCSLSIAVQLDLLKRNKLETSNEMLEQILHMEKERHQMSKETIEMINLKCHDLKYQIQALEDINSQSERREKLEELKNDISIYDSIVNSGNDAIDLILTEKSLLCHKYNIRFSYIVDGSKLAFMEVTDLYSLLSNAIDNAIESVIREPEEKRIISLNISEKNRMQFIHIENNCSEKLLFEDGLPVTTKEDKRYHGYGTRSIRFIAMKYEGELSMRQDGGKFLLDILFCREAVRAEKWRLG